MEVPMLSTIDNPYDPFTQFDEWYAYDHQQGYYTCEYLARVANPPTGIPSETLDQIIIDAVDEICKYNLLGIYCKVYEHGRVVPA